MKYAEVCVNSPIAQRRTFSYSIPEGLNIEVGQAVFVPFGSKLLQGIVMELNDVPAVENVLDIAGVIEARPILSPAHVSLANWLSRHYLSPLFDAVSLMLPPGFERKALTFLSASIPDDFDLFTLSDDRKLILELVVKYGRIGQTQLEKSFGKIKTRRLVSQLVGRGLLSRDYELESTRVKPKFETYLSLAIDADQAQKEIARSYERQTAKQAALLEFLSQQSQPVYIAEAKKACKCDTSVVNTLISKGILQSFEAESAKKGKRPKLFLSLALNAEEARQAVSRLRERMTSKQADLLSYLAEQKEPVSLATARRGTKCDKASIDDLVRKNLIRLQRLEVRRDPLAGRSVNLSFPLTLTNDQHQAFQSICESLRSGLQATPKVFLLHGVTGSGKTEVYLQSLAEAVKLGKRGIVLVPEIALTPQTIERFSSRFAGRVAVLHSQLSPGEQFDEWQRIRKGEVDVVIGPRSALFAPQPDLGLIILDEEHEWTYKQSDLSPRYHARDAAIKLAELTGATVVLGSATPDVESYYHAQRGDYHLLRLPGRVTPMENTPLPQVEVVDLRQELKSGNRSMFSRSLSRSIVQAVSGGGQVMLFLNRRGGATFIQCRDCGFVLACRRCDVALSYHLAEDILACHQCNYRMVVPQTCPKCRSQRIKFLGAGTQKLEQEVAGAFPRARRLRWDSDVTKGKNAHQEILDKFRSHEADILIGTQMITKGLDLPGVTLVGVVNADTALHLPDFRAGERTFQLLSQVAGRAGRGWLGGKVIIQTYSPEHYAVRASAGHDYAGFYAKEIDYRRQLNNPPFSRLASLVYTRTNDAACQREAERMKQVLVEEIEAKGIAGITIIGPAPAFIHRLRGRFRWQIVLRGLELSSFLASLPIPQGWIIDIDPVGLA
ncbi:MAG: primosomal protein N' [Chloroflexi bacterium]|nr:primosomal protein N' [Chloroflexota bacterium]